MALKPVDPTAPPPNPTPREMLRDFSNQPVKGLFITMKMLDGAWSTMIMDLSMEEASYALAQMGVIHQQRIALTLHAQQQRPPEPTHENPAS